jgi:hypothetical protein
MTEYTFLLSVAHFKIFEKKPWSWQFLVDSIISVSKGDKFVLKEVDSSHVLTGKVKSGIVYFVDSAFDIVYLDKSKLCYLSAENEGVGSFTIGDTFIIY